MITWLDPGGRYSRPAVDRLTEIVGATGAVFDRQPPASGALTAAARGTGKDVFGPGARGARASEWRDADMARWAARFAIACGPPRLGTIAADATALTVWVFEGATRAVVAHGTLGIGFTGVEMTEDR